MIDMGFDRDSIWPRASLWFNGVEYQWSGWFGSQLVSWEWRRVPAGTTRDFDVGGKVFSLTVYSTRRDGLKVRTGWALSKSGTHDEHAARVADFRAALQDLV